MIRSAPMTAAIRPKALVLLAFSLIFLGSPRNSRQWSESAFAHIVQPWGGVDRPIRQLEVFCLELLICGVHHRLRPEGWGR